MPMKFNIKLIFFLMLVFLPFIKVYATTYDLKVRLNVHNIVSDSIEYYFSDERYSLLFFSNGKVDSSISSLLNDFFYVRNLVKRYKQTDFYGNTMPVDLSIDTMIDSKDTYIANGFVSWHITDNVLIVKWTPSTQDVYSTCIKELFVSLVTKTKLSPFEEMITDTSISSRFDSIVNKKLSSIYKNSNHNLLGFSEIGKTKFHEMLAKNINFESNLGLESTYLVNVPIVYLATDNNEIILNTNYWMNGIGLQGAVDPFLVNLKVECFSINLKDIILDLEPVIEKYRYAFF